MIKNFKDNIWLYFNSEYFWQNLLLYFIVFLSLGRSFYFIFPGLSDSQKINTYQVLNEFIPLHIFGTILLIASVAIITSTFSLTIESKVILLLGFVTYTVLYVVLTITTFLNVGEWFYSYKYVLYVSFSLILIVKTGGDICRMKKMRN